MQGKVHWSDFCLNFFSFFTKTMMDRFISIIDIFFLPCIISIKTKDDWPICVIKSSVLRNGVILYYALYGCFKTCDFVRVQSGASSFTIH